MSPNPISTSEKSASGTTSDPALQPLQRLIGEWTTEATHPALPDVVVRGTTSVEWLEGKRFIIQRSRTDHPQFPDAICIIGFTDRDRIDDDASDAAHQLTFHYFDSRGVFRVYDVSADAHAVHFQRLAPGFSQRYTGTFSDGGDTIEGLWQVARDDAHWEDDLRITFRRRR